MDSGLQSIVQSVCSRKRERSREHYLLRRSHPTRNHHASTRSGLTRNSNHHISIGQKTHRRTAPEKEKKVATPSQSDSRKNLPPTQQTVTANSSARQLGVEMTRDVVALLNFDQRRLLHDASLMRIRTPRMESAS